MAEPSRQTPQEAPQASPSAATLRDAAALVAAGLVGAERAGEAAQVGARYAIAVTPAMAALIDPADPADPIGRQFLPDIRELDRAPHERDDPIGDDAHAPVEGVVHRYPDRVLLKLLTVCPVYCRFCFRREMVGPPAGGGVLSAQALDTALAYIASDARIFEVILTGGDPLALSPRRLAETMRRLGAIAHVRAIRVHTRLPVVDPARIDAAMIAALRGADKSVWVALHANHPRELTDAARAACARIIDAGLPMVSQSVLLKGVNDDAATLEALMRAFVECRIKPYYLHHPDLAPGTAHWRAPIATGQALMRALRGRLSGLAMPTYVLDLPGGAGKSPAEGAWLSDPDETGAREARDWRGGAHRYVDAPAPGADDERSRMR